MCKLYGLAKSSNPQLKDISIFECGCVDLSDDTSQKVVKEFLTELNSCLEITPFDLTNEPVKTIYVYSHLLAAAKLYKDKFKIQLKKIIVGKNGHGPVDYVIDLLDTTGSKSVCVSKVTKDDFKKGVVQIAVQMESILITHKRTFSEM